MKKIRFYKREKWRRETTSDCLGKEGLLRRGLWSRDLNVKTEPAMERSGGGHSRKRSLQEVRRRSREEFGALTTVQRPVLPGEVGGAECGRSRGGEAAGAGSWRTLSALIKVWNLK